MQPKLHPIFYIKMDNQDTTNLTNPVPTGDAVEFNIDWIFKYYHDVTVQILPIININQTDRQTDTYVSVHRM